MKRRIWLLWTVTVIAVLCSTATLGMAWLRARDDSRTFVPPASGLEMRLRSTLGRYWGTDRTGRLRAGDPAPDFELPRLREDGRVRLSAWQGKKPVALVFGSYT
jgi:hypothetical protein